MDDERRELALLLRRLTVELDAVGQRFADLHGLNRTDVRPLLAELRESRGLDADPYAAYAASGYQERIARERVGGTQAGWGA